MIVERREVQEHGPKGVGGKEGGLCVQVSTFSHPDLHRYAYAVSSFLVTTSTRGQSPSLTSTLALGHSVCTHHLIFAFLAVTDIYSLSFSCILHPHTPLNAWSPIDISGLGFQCSYIFAFSSYSFHCSFSISYFFNCIAVVCSRSATQFIKLSILYCAMTS